MGLASKFRLDAAAAPSSSRSPHTFQVSFSIANPKENYLPGAKAKSKENSEGGPSSHLHRVRGSSDWSLWVAPCLLAPSNANEGRSKPFILNGLHLSGFKETASWLGYLTLNLGLCGSLLVLLVTCLNINYGLLGSLLEPFLTFVVFCLPFS